MVFPHKTRDTNGTVRSVRYENDNLWVLMEVGNPYYVTLNNINYPRFIRTLAIYNFTAPFVLDENPDLKCYESEIQTWAVFGDKVYYSCQNSDGAVPTGHLCSYDRAMKQTQGPVDTDPACTGRRSLILVPGKPGTPSPAYWLVSTSTLFAVLDLNVENYGHCTTFDSNGQSLFRLDDMIETPSQVPPVCVWECKQEKDRQVRIRVILGAVGFTLFVILLAVMLYRRSKQKRKGGLATVAAVLDETATGLRNKSCQSSKDYQRSSQSSHCCHRTSKDRRNNEQRVLEILPKGNSTNMYV
ncbi:hypothetical protein CPC16_011895 [Podila verticillata]|nr:hypothetical protein CPC16_011895 [Podila verticillata]